jgi:hypothetical protein
MNSLLNASALTVLQNLVQHFTVIRIDMKPECLSSWSQKLAILSYLRQVN